METFLVRVWTPGGDERPEGLRGTAVHLNSGQSTTYTAPEQLLTFMTRAVSSEGGTQSAPGAPADGAGKAHGDPR